MNLTFKFCALRMTAIALAVTSLTAAASAEPLSALLGRTHVHGLSLDPVTPGKLTLATHHGLFSADLASLKTVLTGTIDHDFMGFSAVPDTPGAAYASGHPKRGGNLGILKTMDGGISWQHVSAGVDGPVDFHQMVVSAADPATLYGIQRGTIVQQSRDGGETWIITGNAPPKIIAIAASAIDPLVLYAATETGLLRSRNGGAAWEPALDSTGPVSLIHVGPDKIIHAYQLGRGLLRAEENLAGTGLNWTDIGDSLAPAYFLYLARDGKDGGRMFAMTGESAIVTSSDGGASWAQIAQP